MQFFAGKLTFNSKGYYDPNGEVARANFDTIYWAAITVFEVLIGDNWNQVMFDCVKAVGVLSSFYFISLILFGSIIMLNLFLAILLGNFEKARSFWLKKSIFEMFETAIERKYGLTRAMNVILGEVNKSVRDELLDHDPKDIFRLNGRLMIINRKLLENDPEAQDKLVYYDRVALYEMNYKPIIEFTQENIEQEYGDEGDSDDDITSKHNDINDNKNLDKHKEDEDPFEEDKHQLNESSQELVIVKQGSGANLIE